MPTSDDETIPEQFAAAGDLLRASYEELTATVDRLAAELGPTGKYRNRAVHAYRDRLLAGVDRAIDRFLDYCDGFAEPITVVLEDFGYERGTLASATRRPRDVGSWLLPQTRYRLAGALTTRDVRVTYVNPTGTTRTCHACGESGTADGPFRCPNDACKSGCETEIRTRR